MHAACAFAHQFAAGDIGDRDLSVTSEVLAMPVTTMVGVHDSDFFADNARALMARLPQAELAQLEWAGHPRTLRRRPKDAARCPRRLNASPAQHVR